MKLQLKRFGHNVMLVAAIFGAIPLWLGTSAAIVVLFSNHTVLGVLAGIAWIIICFAAFITATEK